MNLAIQYILNCGTQVAGSCHGGMHTGVYQFIQESGFVPYDTCQVYEACSAESDEGSCGKAGKDAYTCEPINMCRTCSTFKAYGGFCSQLDYFPNATVAEYGRVSGEADVMKEIFRRGPVAAEVNASPLDEYTGGIIDLPHESRSQNHIVSITGWGHDEATDTPYWIERNSWGEYWGEMGYIRVAFGSLKVEQQCAWATVKDYTAPERRNQVHCFEDGGNCKVKKAVPELLEKVVGVVEPVLAKKLRGGVVA